MDYNKNFIKEDDYCSIDKAPDYQLFYIVSLLILTSMVFSYSLSIYTVTYFEYNQFHFFIRQTVVGLVGMGVMWFLSQLNPSKYFDYIGVFLLIFFFILMCLVPFIGSEALGAKRWIRLPGFSIAPVEFFKIGFAYFLARSFAKNLLDKPKHMGVRDEFKLYLPYFGVLAVLVGVIAIAQKDFGQTVLIFALTFVLLMFANRSYRIFVFAGIVGILGVIGLIVAAPHRINRIFSWWSMVQDSILSIFPSSVATALRVKDFPEPYQVGHSLNAIHNGGFTGTGLGEGAIKMGFLSEVHTDFVLAGISEEIGFIGLLVVISLLLMAVIRIFRISRKLITEHKNPNFKYHLFTLSIGILISIALLINFGGITGSIPIKGMAVPFLSYGGSSILSLSIAIGLVLSISRKVDNKKR